MTSEKVQHIHQPKVLAVVLNWNGLELTQKCCESLLAQNYKNLDVVIVDNGSTFNTPAQLQAACPEAEIIASNENLGFAGGVNLGFKRVFEEENEYSYVWLLNNDVICEKDALAGLIEKAEAEPQSAAVGCRMREGNPDNKTERIVPAGKRLRPPLFIPAEPTDPEDIDYLCGACMLIRVKALKETSGFDENYFFFFEDADWCFTIRSKGWNISVADGIFITHLGSATIKKMSYNLAAYYRAGHVLFLRKNSGIPFLASLSTTLFRILSDALKLNFGGVKGNISGFLKGWQK